MIAGGAARRAVGLIPLPRGEETMMKLADHASAVNASQRAVESLFDDDQNQIGRLTNLMNRVEDLADRVCGAVPIGTSPVSGESPHVGHIGVLRDFNGRRESIAIRIGEALNRIEQVL